MSFLAIQGNQWISIAMFFLFGWCITMFLLLLRIEQVKKLKTEWIEEINILERIQSKGGNI